MRPVPPPSDPYAAVPLLVAGTAASARKARSTLHFGRATSKGMHTSLRSSKNSQVTGLVKAELWG